MKKLIISLAALVMATGAFAQFNFGVRVGGNLASISKVAEKAPGLDLGDLVTAETTQAMKVGFNAGLYAEYMVMPLLGVQVEANFSSQGVRTNSTVSSSLFGAGAESSTNYNINYLNVPILAKLHFANLRAFVGPQIGFALGGNTVTTVPDKDGGESVTKEPLEADSYSGVDFSFVVGAQMKLTANLGVDARYNIGVGNFFPTLKNDEGEVTREGFGKQGVVQLGVFYEF